MKTMNAATKFRIPASRIITPAKPTQTSPSVVNDSGMDTPGLLSWEFLFRRRRRQPDRRPLPTSRHPPMRVISADAGVRQMSARPGTSRCSISPAASAQATASARELTPSLR
jgi:hypothetical protein